LIALFATSQVVTVAERRVVLSTPGARPKQVLHGHEDYPLETDEREVYKCQRVYLPTKVTFDIDEHMKEVREIHKKQ
jgi:hypothetical protein